MQLLQAMLPCKCPVRKSYLGEEVWQPMIRVLHVIKLLTHTIGHNHTFLSLIRINYVRYQAMTCVEDLHITFYTLDGQDAVVQTSQTNAPLWLLQLVELQVQQAACNIALLWLVFHAHYTLYAEQHSCFKQQGH